MNEIVCKQSTTDLNPEWCVIHNQSIWECITAELTVKTPESTASITQHEGNKYLRVIRSAFSDERPIHIDVYAVLIAFSVSCPARAQAIKKLLCAGLRGKGNERDDLVGAKAAIERAIELLPSEDK